MSLYKRLIVIGTTGSGKSTLARQLAEKLGCPFIEMDALYWEPNWEPAPKEVFHARIEQATQNERWAAAGNFSSVRELVWLRADAIIWLDYPMLFTFGRLWTRTWSRWWTQEELWSGNRETLWYQFKLWSDDSLFHWFFKTYWRRKREYTQLLAQPQYQHIRIFHFKSQNETSAWFENMNVSTGL
jgi:adenylate kinase family enzyme